MLTRSQTIGSKLLGREWQKGLIPISDFSHLLVLLILLSIVSTIENSLHKFTTDSRMVVATNGREKENGEWLFNGAELLIWNDEKVLMMDSGNDCTITWMYLMPINCTFKNS